MEHLRRSKVVDVLTSRDYGTEVLVKGWVRTQRSKKNFAFIELNDGSIIKNIQIFVDFPTLAKSMFGLPEEKNLIDDFGISNQVLKLMKEITTGSAIAVKGVLVESMGQGQHVEIQARSIELFGTADPETYPLQKKGHTLEFLREIAHLRPRTNTFGAVLRIRHAMAFAIHKYFNDHGFYYIHTPIVTGSDAEGAGAMFRVTTLDPVAPPLTADGKVNFAEDFFGKETNLTVSGQLEAELGAMALSLVYTFGPTFRAENSNTPRHLAEFWMIEPEMAFYDIHDNMDLAEDFLKSLMTYALEHCMEDLEFLNRMYDNELIERLRHVIESRFERLTYTEAIGILKASGQKWDFPVDWGSDLQAEHERYLVEKHFQRPVMLTDYPKEIKAFYMKQNDDNKTVRGLDVLFPRIGEIIGGSQREENYERLIRRINELKIPEKDVWWYLDTRRFGTAPHSGFGLGFERLILFVTGMSNIRDVIPFPRTPKNAEF
ncbi:MAG: asparagine--tRNA ligase [Bacteroidales bacterium]|nr:asparagine--tRNA ligase [Bacteroidales bacterium]